MSKRMPADLPNGGPYRCRPQMTLQDVLLPSGSASSVCEDPVLRAHVQAPLLQFLQKLSKTGIDGKSFARGFSFRIASLAVYNSSSNEDREILPVEVSPLQAHDFAGAKAETGPNQNHGVVWLGQLRQKDADFAWCEHAWYASTAAALAH